MAKKWGKWCEEAPKMMSKWGPKSIKNLYKSELLRKRWFSRNHCNYCIKWMIFKVRGGQNHPKSIQKWWKKEVRKRIGKMMPKSMKMELKWSPKGSQNQDKSGKMTSKDRCEKKWIFWRLFPNCSEIDKRTPKKWTFAKNGKSTKPL